MHSCAPTACPAAPVAIRKKWTATINSKTLAPCPPFPNRLLQSPDMRILHILDHSIPLHSGYTFRTRSILREQQALGWETFHVTGSKQNSGAALEEEVDGLHFYRTPPITGRLAQLPVLNQKAVIDGLARRLSEIIPI